MPGLSNIFGSDDSSSSESSSNSSDITGVLDSTLGLDVDSSQSNYNEDEDGNVSEQNNDNSVGLDTSTDGLLNTVSDSMSSSDESTS